MWKGKWCYVILIIMMHVCLLSLSCSGTNETTSVDAANPQRSVELLDPTALKSVGKVVLSLNGLEPYEAGFLSDAVAVILREVGWEVADYIEIAKATQAHMQNKNAAVAYRQFAIQQGDSTVQFSLPSTNPEELDYLEVARRVNADALLIGTVLFGKHYERRAESDEEEFALDRIIVTSLSLKIVDLATESTILEMVSNYERGRSSFDVAKDVATMLSEQLSRAEQYRPLK